MLFEGLPTEPDTAGWFAWCRAHESPPSRPPSTASSCASSPATSTRRCSTWSSSPASPSRADGRRLGQGGGHYDRFLPRLRPDCRTVGAAFAEQLLDDLPTEPHDVRLDLVVTDA